MVMDFSFGLMAVHIRGINLKIKSKEKVHLHGLTVVSTRVIGLMESSIVHSNGIYYAIKGDVKKGVWADGKFLHVSVEI